MYLSGRGGGYYVSSASGGRVGVAKLIVPDLSAFLLLAAMPTAAAPLIIGVRSRVSLAVVLKPPRCLLLYHSLYFPYSLVRA
jgi:hypothetical protein